MIAQCRRGALMRGVLTALFCWQAASAPASDVPYVPTPMPVVDAMLGMGGVGPDDFLIDLGSGDGRIPIRAATRFGTRGMGVDLDDHLVRTARADAQQQGVQDKVVFAARDLFETDLTGATVVTAYLFNSVNMRLRPRLFEQLRPGARIVSHDFDFGNWQPDQKITIDVPGKAYGPPTSEIMLWVVPANFAGTWQWTLPGAAGDVRHEAKLEQKFQVLDGSVVAQGQRHRLGEPRVKGDVVSFTLTGSAGAARYTGRISGNSITGEVVRGGERPLQWRAVRIKTGKMDIGAGPAHRAVIGSLTKEQ